MTTISFAYTWANITANAWKLLNDKVVTVTVTDQGNNSYDVPASTYFYFGKADTLSISTAVFSDWNDLLSTGKVRSGSIDYDGTAGLTRTGHGGLRIGLANTTMAQLSAAHDKGLVKFV